MKKIILSAAMLGALSLSANIASATPTALNNFNTNYTTSVTSCALCHTTADGNANSALNAFGSDFKAAGGGKPNYAPNFTALDAMDSDGDGTTNGAEIAAGTAPGGNGTLASPTSTATTTTTTPSSSGGGGGGCIASSVTTPLMMVLAMLSLGFFVRRKKG